MSREVDKVAFGRRVLRRRTMLGLSQGELGKKIGMSQQGIGNLEKGVVKRMRKLLELADALKTTQDWLLYADGQEDAPAEGDIAAIWQHLKPLERRAIMRFITDLLTAREGAA